MPRGHPDDNSRRPVLFQVCRAGDRLEVGDGPFDLSRIKSLLLGRGAEGGYDARASDDAVRVDDPWMSSRHAAVERRGAERVLLDLGSTNGIAVNGQAVHECVLEDGDLVETGRTFWLYLVLPGDPPPVLEPADMGGMTSWNPLLAEQLEALRAVAASQDHVLLSGDDGVGKAFCARAIHRVSRRPGHLVRLDCAMEGDQLARELLGEEDVNEGALGQSSQGTLVLEHVESMPMELQAALAGVLETSRVAPLSGGRGVAVDLRVVALGTGDLDNASRRSRFARSLLEHLTGFTLSLPPLRERREDLGLLMDAILAGAGGTRAISRDACRALLMHRWPRNVLELTRVLEAAVILAGSDPVDLPHLPAIIAARGAPPAAHTAENEVALPLPRIRPSRQEPVEEEDDPAQGRSDQDATHVVAPPPPPPRRSAPVRPEPPKRGNRVSRDGVEEREVIAQLKRARGNVTLAARGMGRARAEFQRLVDEFGLDPADYRGSGN